MDGFFITLPDLETSMMSKQRSFTGKEYLKFENPKFSSHAHASFDLQLRFLAVVMNVFVPSKSDEREGCQNKLFFLMGSK